MAPNPARLGRIGAAARKARGVLGAGEAPQVGQGSARGGRGLRDGAMRNNINETLDKIMAIEGALAVSLVDASSGFMLGSRGESVDIELASACVAELLNFIENAKKKAAVLNKPLTDVVISYAEAHCVLVPVAHVPGAVFLFFARRDKIAMALARRQLRDCAENLQLD